VKQDNAAVEVLQWFFDLDMMVEACNGPLDVEMFVESKQSLDSLLGAKKSAEDVGAAYRRLALALAPNIMNVLLQGDEAFPEGNHSGRLTPPSPGKLTLYVDPTGRRVFVDLPSRQNQPAAFSVEWAKHTNASIRE
jgi:hypothetical protein